MQAAPLQKQTNILLIETAEEDSQNLDEYLQKTANLLCETLEISYCLVRVSKSNLKNYHVSHNNLKNESLITFSEELIESYQSSLFRGQPLAFSKSDRLFKFLAQKNISAYQISSLLLVPIVYQQFYLGEIVLFCCEEHQWLETELKLVLTIAERCAFKIIQTQLDEQLKSQKWQQNLFNQILEKINTNLSPKESLADILLILGTNLQAEQVVIFDLREENSQIYQQWQRERTTPVLTALNIPWWKEFKKVKIQEAELKIEFYKKLQAKKNFTDNLQQARFSEGTETELFSSLKESYRSSVSSLWHIPIFIRGDFFGILTLKIKFPSLNLATEEINFLNLIAQQIAIAIHNIQIQEQLDRLEKCNQDLEAEKQISEAANHAKSVFLSHMNHELRTPLTGILGFARMLKDEIYGSLNPKQKQYVSAIASSGEHLLSLVNDFLDISKIEANREELLLETMAVEDLCIASLSMVESRAKEQGLDLRLEIAPNVDLCQADRRRVIQILVNLLSNAIKFTEIGAVTLRVQRQEEKLEFCVIDTGIGIKKADQEKLFQPFQQINNPLTRKHKGTGLGLTLSRKLAQLHGGELILCSEEGKGSCFTLQLPV
jgi:signal transduction histidine kinase